MIDHAMDVSLIAYEPIPIADTFATGLMPVETVGPLMRLTFYTDRKDPSGAIERCIVARILADRRLFGGLWARDNAPLEASGTGIN